MCKNRFIPSVSTVQQGSQKVNWKPACRKVVRQARENPSLWTPGSLQASQPVLLAVNSQTARQRKQPRIAALSPGQGVLMDGCEELDLGWGERWAVWTYPAGLSLSQAKQYNHREANQADLRSSGFTQLCASHHRDLPGLWVWTSLEEEVPLSQRLLPRSNVPVPVLSQKK